MSFHRFSFNYLTTEITKLKEEEANVGNIKAQFEKQLLNERTLKTQVSKYIQMHIHLVFMNQIIFNRILFFINYRYVQ